MMDIQSGDAVLDHGKALLNEGRAEEALSAAETLRGSLLPSSVRGTCLALQVVALERLERYEDARKLIEETMAQERDDFNFVLSAGIAFTELLEPEHANIFLENLCELDRENPAPCVYYGIALGYQGRWDDAMEAHRQALSRDPAFDSALAQLAYCQEMLHCDDEAMATYETYLAIDPSDGLAWTRLAMLRSARGDVDGAYRDFEAASESGGDDEEIYFNWGLTAAQRGDGETLKRCLTGLEAIAAQGWRTWILRAELYESQGEKEEAAGAYEAALESVLSESNPEMEAAAAAASLRFALRTEANPFAEKVESWIFDQCCFAPDVLELMLLRSGAEGPAGVYEFRVRSKDGGEYFYGVSAESLDSADAYAQAFHERAQLGEIESLEATKATPPGTLTVQPLGVFFLRPMDD